MIEMVTAGIQNTIWYIVAILVLVAFHEFGHFWAARRLGVKVLRFSIGFGKPIWKRTAADGVEYVIAMIPLGGYVKLLGERDEDVPVADRAKAFHVQPIWARITILAAGPLFNFLLAIAFYWATFVVGIPDMKPILAEPSAGSAAAVAGLHGGDRVETFAGAGVTTWTELHTQMVTAALSHAPVTLTVADQAGQQRTVEVNLSKVRVDPQYLFDDLGFTPFQPEIKPLLGEIEPGSAAESAGLKPQDEVVAIDGVAIATWQQFLKVVSSHAGDALKFQIRRDGALIEKTIIIGSRGTGDQVRGHLGAVVSSMASDEKLWQDLRAESRLGPVAAVPAALHKTWDMTRLVGQLMFRMVIGDISVKNLSGPISTAQAAGFAAKAGVATFLGFIAFVSLNLGIVNLIPIPILDGGQIVSCLVEAVKGGPLSQRAQVLVQQFGLALLILIMGFVFYNDIARQFG